jgi:hypothetical protein
MKKTLFTLVIALLSYYSYATNLKTKTYNRFVDLSVSFTPTGIGWYRITAAGYQGGTIQITGGYDNRVTDVEFQYNIGGWRVGGSIQQTRYSSYNNGCVDQVRISSDGLANSYLDIHVSSATVPGVIYISGRGMNMNIPSFITNPTIDAEAGSTDVNILTLTHGFNSTQGATFAVTGGNVGIGTSLPDAKLTVKGLIHTQEVKVDLQIPGPDYVFNDDYKLITLAEIKDYIAKNHHLPEIPSAVQMEKEGINVGDMNIKLLKKVEELTLYLIEKDQQLIEQKKVNQSLQEQINQLAKKINK